MRLFALIMAILIAFPNLGSAFTLGGCCGSSAVAGEEIVQAPKVKVKTCCSHSPEEDGENECGSKCKCASCFSPILFNTTEEVAKSTVEIYSSAVADVVLTYFFELPFNVWQPPKQA